MTHANSLLARRYKALSHPIRIEILRVLEAGRVASPAQLAEVLNESLTDVAYHVRQLVKFTCLELVETSTAKGTVEHFYRAIERPYYDYAVWAELSPEERATVTHLILSAILADVTAAEAAGTIDSRDDRHITRYPLHLDAHGWRLLEAKLVGVLEEAQQLAADAAAKVATGDLAPEDLVPARLMMLLFEAAPMGTLPASPESPLS